MDCLEAGGNARNAEPEFLPGKKKKALALPLPQLALFLAFRGSEAV